MPVPSTSERGTLRSWASSRSCYEEVAEVIVGDDGAVEGDDEDLALEARDVLENAAQVGGLNRGGQCGSLGGRECGRGGHGEGRLWVGGGGCGAA